MYLCCELADSIMDPTQKFERNHNHKIDYNRLLIPDLLATLIRTQSATLMCPPTIHSMQFKWVVKIVAVGWRAKLEAERSRFTCNISYCYAAHGRLAERECTHHIRVCVCVPGADENRTCREFLPPS